MNKEAIISARAEGSKFKSYSSQSQIETTLRWAINDAMKLRGQNNADENVMQTMTNKIAEIIIRDYPSLTDKEFSLILEAGISGDLGKETWVSGAAIIQWLRMYKADKAYIAVIDEQEEERKDKTRVTKEEIDRLNNIAFEKSFERGLEYYKENGTIFQPVGEKENDDRAFHLPQWASQVYQHYRKLRKIPAPSDAEIDKAENRASNEIAKGFHYKFNANILKVAKEDWINSFLLESYYSKI